MDQLNLPKWNIASAPCRHVWGMPVLLSHVLLCSLVGMPGPCHEYLDCVRYVMTHHWLVLANNGSGGTVKTGSSWSGPDEGGKCNSVRLSAACLSKVATICTHQQNTLFWTVLDRATQIPRAHSLVHSGQVCPDTHFLWVPVQLCPDTHSYELLSSSGQYNPNSSIILPFITRLS